MVPSWGQYNLARLPLAFPVNPEDVGRPTSPQHDRHVFDSMCPLLVKICVSSRAGEPAGEFTGFLYSSSSCAIVTAASCIAGGFGGNHPPGAAPPAPPAAEVFRARYSDGFEEDVEVLAAAANGIADLAILRGSRPAPRSLIGMPCSTGDAVYTLGRSPAAGSTPCCLVSKGGVVSSSRVGCMAVAARADRGCRGGPVVNTRGQLLGVVNGELLGTAAAAFAQAGITPAADVHTFLLQSGQPGLA